MTSDEATLAERVAEAYELLEMTKYEVDDRNLLDHESERISQLLLDLHAAATREGFEAWAVYAPSGELVILHTEDTPVPLNEGQASLGYTLRRIRCCVVDEGQSGGNSASITS